MKAMLITIDEYGQYIDAIDSALSQTLGLKSRRIGRIERIPKVHWH